VTNTQQPSPVRRAYDATWGRFFAASYDRLMKKGEEGELGQRREAVVSRAAGRTLELGAGTGLNLRRYGPAVTELVLTEPFEPMARRLRERAGAPGGPPTEVVETPAEQLPFADDSFDTVVATLVLCTVDDPARTLAEVDRVLKPGGRFLFFEHVRAESDRLARVQDVLHGPWYFFGHGCHANRDTVASIRASGLEIEDLERGEVAEMPPIVKPVVWGSALSQAAAV
jgi:ubiquinone/menaquinone biosynthesis C-methylase UbiE